MGIVWGVLYYGYGFCEFVEYSVYFKIRVVNDSRYGCISFDIREVKKLFLFGVLLFIWFIMIFVLVGIQFNVLFMEYLDICVLFFLFVLNVVS